MIFANGEILLNNFFQLFPLQSKSFAINGVFDTNVISELIKKYFRFKAKVDKVFIVDAMKLDIDKIDSSVSYLCNQSDTKYENNYDNLPSIFEYFKELDNSILGSEPVYFIIRLPRIKDISGDSIIMESEHESEIEDIEEDRRDRIEKTEHSFNNNDIKKNILNKRLKRINDDCDNRTNKIKVKYGRKEVNNKCWEMFSFVRSLEDTKNIKMVFVGDWDQSIVRELFNLSQDSYPFQDNESYLESFSFNSSPESDDYKILLVDKQINNKDIIRKLYDYCKGDILSTIFLIKHLRAENPETAEEVIRQSRYDFYKYWKESFLEYEIDDFKEKINQDTISIAPKKDSKESHVLYRTMIFKTHSKGHTMIFRPKNYFYHSIII